MFVFVVSVQNSCHDSIFAFFTLFLQFSLALLASCLDIFGICTLGLLFLFHSISKSVLHHGFGLVVWTTVFTEFLWSPSSFFSIILIICSRFTFECIFFCFCKPYPVIENDFLYELDSFFVSFMHLFSNLFESLILIQSWSLVDISSNTSQDFFCQLGYLFLM